MKTKTLIALAGGKSTGRATLAALLGITPLATYKWGVDVPERHVWRLQVLKPEWFKVEVKT